MSKNDKEVVSALRAGLTERIGKDRFDLWFGAGVSFCWDGAALHVLTAEHFILERLRNRFRRELEAVALDVLSPQAKVEFRLQEQPATAPNVAGGEPVGRRHATPGVTARRDRAAPVQTASSEPPALVRRSFTLDGFVVGQGNRLAVGAVQTVLRSPGQFTPLFLYGPPGTGKTHLLEGLAASARRLQGQRRAVLLSAEQFTSSFLEALRGSGLPSFRRKYRDVDVLLIDDLQFFFGKKATVNELQYTVDALLRDGRQLVLAADRSPAELGGLGVELIARITGGLVCGLESADEETRLGILRQLAQRHDRAIPAEVLERIAGQLTGDARQLTGALNRLVAAGEALRQPITASLAEQCLADIFQGSRRAVRLADIDVAVCEAFGIQTKSLQAAGKSKSLSQPRMLAMWLARKYTRAAFSEIGEYFGRRSHSTVISAQKKVEDWVADGTRLRLANEDCDIRDAIRRLEGRLRCG